MKIKFISMLMCLLFLYSLVPSALSIPQTREINNNFSDEINNPEWNIDDEWIYQVSLSMSTHEDDVDTSININIVSLILSVESENNDYCFPNYNIYTLISNNIYINFLKFKF